MDRGRRLYTGYHFKTLSDFFSHDEISILFTYFIYLFYLFIYFLTNRHFFFLETGFSVFYKSWMLIANLQTHNKRASGPIKDTVEYWNRLFTVPYFYVRSSGSSELRYACGHLGHKECHHPVQQHIPVEAKWGSIRPRHAHKHTPLSPGSSVNLIITLSRHSLYFKRSDCQQFHL